MFARSVTIRLKPDRVAEYTRIVQTDVLPLLRRQNGFQDEITLLLPDGLQAVAISLWDYQEAANAYSDTAYPQVLKTLENVAEGPPEVHTFEVANSTFHKIAACVAL